MAESLRILFLGQKPLGERCFEILRSRASPSLQVAGVVTNQSTDVWWTTNRIWKTAQENNLPAVDNAQRNTSAILELCEAERVNTIISVQHAWILPPSILKFGGEGAFNLHNAKLPEYKGHNCCNHAILNNEKTYTTTLHRMNEEVDAGDIVRECELAIVNDETARSLYLKSNKAAIELFRWLLRELETGGPLTHKKIEGRSEFYPRSSLDHERELRAGDSEETRDRKIRALYFPPFEPAYEIRSGSKTYLLPHGCTADMSAEAGARYYEELS